MENRSTRDPTLIELVVSRAKLDVQFPRPRINGAIDTLYVEHQDGSFECTGSYLSISRFSSKKYFGRNSTIKVRINGVEIPDLSIKLDRISGQNGKGKQGVPTVTLNDNEKRMIFTELKKGRNEITYYFEGHPDSKVDARVFRWDWNAKIGVMDIDGTATRSDLMGLIYSYVDKPYLHKGVSEFLSYLKKQNYQLIYLTARPISIINSTRKYLPKKLHQEGIDLPDGPVFTSCDGRMRTSLNYLRDKTGLGGTTHYHFKYKFLQEIQKLFCSGKHKKLGNPFVAGFGNTENDASSYRGVGIPENKIFILSEDGKITCPSGETFTSYDDLLNACQDNGTFPFVEGIGTPGVRRKGKSFVELVVDWVHIWFR